MLVLSQPVLDNFSVLKPTCKPTPNNSNNNRNVNNKSRGIPVIDLLDPGAAALIVQASQEFGFFKVVNHGVRMELMSRLEEQALKFFHLPQCRKDKAGPPNPFGYGNKKIGPNGDVGWVEYLLLSTNPHLIIPHDSPLNFNDYPEIFWCVVNEYVTAVRNMACEVLEKAADGLGIKPRDALSRMLRDEKSDSCFRLNHYPPYLKAAAAAMALSGGNLIGFGEHTDPQIISVVRSNNTTGLQISLRDGSWLSVPPDHSSFFINVGDSLQVMTNGRFRSVRHRVMADSVKSRVSMIYFGGPPLSEKIAPLTSLVKEGETSLYKEFTWLEYKQSAYKTRLGDNRLALFQNSAAHAQRS